MKQGVPEKMLEEAGGHLIAAPAGQKVSSSINWRPTVNSGAGQSNSSWKAPPTVELILLRILITFSLGHACPGNMATTRKFLFLHPYCLKKFVCNLEDRACMFDNFCSVVKGEADR